jgi:iron(III) transport system substrate-binding protein
MKRKLKQCGEFHALLAVMFFVVLSYQAWAKGSADKPAPLILYTNSGDGERGKFLVERSKAAGFDIQVLQIGGGDLVNRVIAEKNNPVADMVFGPNAMDVGKIAREGLLYKFEPAWKNKIDQSLLDSGGMFYPIGISPVIMIYNTDVYTPSTAPRDWQDLATNPKYKGKYNIFGLGGTVARSVVVSILMQYKDPNGVYGISAQGWDLMRQFIQGGHLEQQGDDWFGEIQRGEYPIGEIWLGGLLVRQKELNATNVDFIVPEIGVPYVQETIGIIKNNKNEGPAKQWVDWFGSTEVQAEWSARFGHTPTNQETYNTFSSEMRNAMSRLRSQQIDWNFAMENLDKWIEKIQLEFVK